MDKFTDELKAKKVINRDDIQTFKNYIDKKYAKNQTKERASMLSNTIHHILYTKLEGIPDEYKSSIKVNILKNTFAKNKTSITMYDVFNCCLMENELKTNCTSLLTNWLNLNIDNPITDEDLKSYLGLKEEVKDKLKVKNTDDSKPMVNVPDNTITVENNTSTYKFSNTSLKYLKKLKFNSRVIITFSGIIFLIMFYPISKVAYSMSSKSNFKFYSFKEKSISQGLLQNTSSKFSNAHLPDYMKYKDIDEVKLKKFLTLHKSLLVKEPYFSTIMSVAKEFNLNPLVLFAITGQEQSFVPEDTKFASKIANNPFNVFHSWQEYNTDIKDTSKIAARTVINLSKDMPKDSDPFLWVGKSYAEDKNWGKGVEAIFKDLSEKCK
ncbi:hypothetical protein Ccar_06350 [Clostridium carboxidivorans P7]|uniref:Uncharacterized protein n=2 Tax=Clostridium TaxID=1485 RepID=C6PTC3_9CLOT|nr:glucosaminidase domain-containing protein [Clostridium carboxidivorans]AKN30464.1 hypothetical protein Ccar_06350 [Clostridium carboxidivorans P7]EET87543.1 conserved hypothetical protein [Clostridium carboxidivorans P7]